MSNAQAGWYSKIPAGWRVVPLKFAVCQIGSGGTPLSSHEEYWADNGYGIPWVAIGDMSNVDTVLETSKRITESGRASKALTIYPAGTLLYSMYASIGKVSRLGLPATINQAILAIDPNERLCTTEYLRWLLNYVTERILEGTNSNTQDNLNLQKVRNARLLLPPLEEQAAVSDFLDRETARVDTLVAKYERLIELLEEKRIALIRQAMTKGLDPTLPMKHSGVEWIGEMPTSWNVMRLRFLCDITTGGRDTVDATDEGRYPFFVRSQEVKTIDEYAFDCEAVLTAGDGVGVGKVFHHFNGKFNAHQRVYVMSKFRRINGRFFYYFLRSNFYRVTIQGTAKSTVDSIRRPTLQNFQLCVPSLKQQSDIVKYCDSVDDLYDRSLRMARKAIAIASEHRSALITAAVTGQIDVRTYRPQASTHEALA